MDICWKKTISWLPWGGNPSNEGCFPKRLGSPPKNNGVKKGFPLVEGVKVMLLKVAIQWWGQHVIQMSPLMFGLWRRLAEPIVV